MMNKIRIETAENGYIATECSDREMGMIMARDPYVFETFDSLVKWLSQNLEKPKNDPAQDANFYPKP